MNMTMNIKGGASVLLENISREAERIRVLSMSTPMCDVCGKLIVENSSVPGVCRPCYERNDEMWN